MFESEKDVAKRSIQTSKVQMTHTEPNWAGSEPEPGSETRVFSDLFSWFFDRILPDEESDVWPRRSEDPVTLSPWNAERETLRQKHFGGKWPPMLGREMSENSELPFETQIGNSL